MDIRYKQYDALNETDGQRDNEQKPSEKLLTVDDVIEEIGFGKYQVFILVVAGVIWLSDGIEILLVSIIGPVLLCEWHLATWQEAIITTTAFFGYTIGSLLLGMFSDVYGRKMTLVFGACWVLFYGILSAGAPGIIWLVILRLLVGIGLGAIPQAVTYYAELVPSRHRGKAIVLIEVFFAIGGSIAALLALLILVPYGWRAWLVACAMPSLLFLLISPWLPESPRFNLVSGRPHKAKETLELAASVNKRSMPQGELYEQQQEKRGRLSSLWTPIYRRTSLLLAILWFSSIFVYMGVVLIGTELIKSDSCYSAQNTANATSTNGKVEIFSCSLSCHTLSFGDLEDIFITSIGELPGLILTAILVDLVGRKATYVINFGMLSLICLILNFCLPRTLTIVFIFIARALAASLVQISFLYTPEAYHTSIRSVALGAGSSCGRVGAMITPYVAQVLLHYSPRVALGIYASISVVGAVAAILLPIETKGKSLE